VAELAVTQGSEAILLRGPEDLPPLGFGEAVWGDPSDGRTVEQGSRGELRNGVSGGSGSETPR
jgi:hypothetical protein